MIQTGRALARAGLGLSLLVATAVRLPHLDFVPIWDGRNYWDDCVQPALLGSFDPLAFNCFGHRSMLYMLAVSWPQYLNHGSPLLLNLTHLCVSLLTIWAFHRVAIVIVPPSEERGSGLVPALATMVFASMPAWTASSVNLNPDSGVLASFLFALGFFLRRRLIPATIAGLFLVLSKATGMLLWLMLVAIEAAFAIHEKGWRKAGSALLKRAHLILPLLAYAAVGMALTAAGRQATWGQKVPLWELALTFLSADLFDPIFGAYIADLFVLNFAWIMTSMIVAWLVATGLDAFRSRPFALPRAIEPRSAAFTGLAALGTIYLLTRYPTFNNPRYLLPAFPMVVLVFMAATLALISRPRMRAGLFVIVALLQIGSMSRTFDPISKFAFGTFRFGDH
ncbi:MAG TPA: hypothetical protein VFL80_09200, partial [Thermoanaerobaculia bacterium]|nr:hypothetical protein [Thermoanaerobaculia bacterium]